MPHFRTPITVGLVFCLLLAQSLSGTVVPRSIKRQIDDFGVGARVRVTLAGGKQLRGSVEAIGDRDFVISDKGRVSRHVPYEHVAQLRLAERAYRAKAHIDPAAARRVVLNLGVGRHAVVRFGGRELHGNIQAIDAAHFTLLPDHTTAPVEIPYDHVQYVEKNLTLGATIVLVVLIVAGVAVIAAVAK